MFAALWVERRLLVDLWRLGEGIGMLRLGRGLLERKLADGVIFGSKREEGVCSGWFWLWGG